MKYDTIEEFNVDWKAAIFRMVSLSLSDHDTDFKVAVSL